MDHWQEQGKRLLGCMPVKGKKVIDAGCGDGWASLLLKERGANVTAFDKLGRDHPKLVEIMKANIHYTPTLGGVENYDLIWCHHVLEHIPSPIDFLRNLQRSGEQLWLVVPKATLKGYAKDHINNYTMPSLIEHLRMGGWDVARGSYTTQPGPSVGALWAVVNRLDTFESKDESTWSIYPEPMDVLNTPGENHLRREVDNWNWTLTKEEGQK